MDLYKILEIVIWPISIIIIALLFRDKVMALLDKKDIKLKDSKHTVEFATNSNITEQKVEKSPSAKELAKIFDSAVLVQQENDINKELQGCGSNTEEKIELLVRALVVNQLVVEFERIDKVIWGSQLALLTHLNSKISGEKIDQLRCFYTNAKEQAQNGLVGYSFEQYLDFSVVHGLTVKEGEQYCITDYGKEFLLYITKMGYSSNRIL